MVAYRLVHCAWQLFSQSKRSQPIQQREWFTALVTAALKCSVLHRLPNPRLVSLRVDLDVHIDSVSYTIAVFTTGGHKFYHYLLLIFYWPQYANVSYQPPLL